ncbi:hypothetical protein G6F40_012927 [Rhizopus arrhizus]|nr:hypothetical protein G6F40_012927 [Rhizopus arrhizus]
MQQPDVKQRRLTMGSEAGPMTSEAFAEFTPVASVARGDSGQRLRSGAFAPDCPLVIFVVACGNCLQIPSGLSTPRTSRGTAATGSAGCNLTVAGENRVLAFSSTILRGEGSCAARSRPAARAAFGSIRSVLRREDAGCIQRVTYRRCMTHDGLRAMDVPVLRTDLPRSTHPTQAIDVGSGVVHLRRMGGVRSGRPKHTGVCRT